MGFAVKSDGFLYSTYRPQHMFWEIWILLRKVGFAASNSEARRLLTQGAVSLDGEKIIDAEVTLEIRDEAILKVGKRRICRVRATLPN